MELDHCFHSFTPHRRRNFAAMKLYWCSHIHECLYNELMTKMQGKS